MAISKDIAKRLKGILREHPEGLSITDIVRKISVNRNTASRYLDMLLVSGQVEMRHFGMAKIYTVTSRLPISSVLEISSDYVLQIDQSFRIIFINVPFLKLLQIPERGLLGKKIEFTGIPTIFGGNFPCSSAGSAMPMPVLNAGVNLSSLQRSGSFPAGSLPRFFLRARRGF